MSTLSLNATKRLHNALCDKSAGNEVATILNKALASAEQDLTVVPAIIVATSTSTTTDFAALAVGDKVLMVPAVAGNSIFYTVATAGTLPAAAVVGNLYVILRTLSVPADVAFAP
jgi:hypothetical protein